MKEYILANFLDPIAKVWGNAQPLHPTTYLKVKRPRKKNKNKRFK